MVSVLATAGAEIDPVTDMITAPDEHVRDGTSPRAEFEIVREEADDYLKRAELPMHPTENPAG